MHQNQSTPIPNALLIYITLLLSLACFSFVLCMRPLAIGYWFQSETPIAFLQLLTGLLFCGFLAAHRYAPEEVNRIIKNPVVWLPFSITLLSLFLAPFARIPKTALFGSPELGQGPFSFLMLSIIAASTLLLMPHLRARKFLGGVACLSTLIVTLLTFGWPDKPYYFDDYIAFYGIFLFGIVCFLWDIHSVKKQMVVALLCSIPIYLSGNKSAMVLWGLTLLATPLFFWILNRWAPNRKRFWATLVTLLSPIPLMLGIALIASQHTNGGKLETLWSRHNLTQVVAQAIHLKPSLLLTGMGWGSYSEASILAIDIQKMPTFNQEQFVWEFLIDRNPFHSHNELAESLLSVGVIGLLLMWLLYALFPLTAPSPLLPIGTILGITSLTLGTTWFQMPISLPLMGIALGSLCSGESCLAPTLKKSPACAGAGRALAPTFLLAALFSFWGAYQTFWIMKNDIYFKPPPRYEVSQKESCGDGLVDWERGGYWLAQYFRNIENQIKSLPEQAKEFHLFESAQWLQCAVNRQWHHQPTLRLMASDLINYSEWAHYDGDASAIPDYALEGWKEKIDLWLQTVPQRTDLVAPYFLWKLSRNEEAETLPLLESILKRNPEDLVGLWFSGIYYLSQPETFDKGRHRMKRAVALGITHIIPVEDEILNAL